ncbi:MAG TPA: hypothetical protein VJT81_15995 [Burkholderiales bacterium]|nr:hypothetical protein [Burkholderiales bacterium]
MSKIAATLAAYLFFGLIVPVDARTEECVSMLVDLRGSVALAKSPSANPQDHWPVSLLHCFARRDVLSLSEADEATLYFPDAGTAVGLRGRGQYVIESNAVRPIGNAPAPSSTVLNSVFKGVNLARENLTRAGVRMRETPNPAGIVQIAPQGIVTDVEPLVFRWYQGDTRPPYRIRIVTSSRTTVYEGPIANGDFRLPPEVNLPPGEQLSWRVEAVDSASSGGRWQEFVVATRDARELAARIDKMVPSPTDVERNLRNVLLLQKMSSEP